MSLSRKMLKAMGIEDEKIEQIIEAHTETTNALKGEIERYKEESDKLPELQKKFDELKASADEGKTYKEKYENEHNAFEQYKVTVENEKVKSNKVKAYKELLKKAGVKNDENGRRYDNIVRVTELDDIKLDDEGHIHDSEKLVEKIKEEWGGFVVKERTEGAGTETPPSGNGSGNPPSRAAMVAAKHNEMLYGVKGDSK